MRGRVAAHVDIRRGRYQMLGYGLPVPWRPEYARCLRERYKIEFRPVAGCLVSDSLVSYVNTYDSVIEEAARAKLGRDVVKECADESMLRWKAQRAMTAKNAQISARFDGNLTVEAYIRRRGSLIFQRLALAAVSGQRRQNLGMKSFRV
jgi:hypothetical protein